MNTVGKNFRCVTTNTMSKRPRSPDARNVKRQRIPAGFHRMPDGSVMKGDDHSELLAAADSLLARPDLCRSDPLPRAAPEAADPWAAMRRASPKRKPLARVSHEEAAGRHRTAAIEVPNAPRRRGENRAASTMNRAPGWRSAMVVPMGAPVIDLT
jgi:hypothetical protein